jgi:RHS repeat-associated protein
VLKESGSGDSVLYLYDQADRCVAEYTSADDCAALTYSAGYVYADADGLGAPVAVEDAGGGYDFIATDPQGNVIYQTPSSSYIALIKYDAYGNVYNISPGYLNLPFRFAGMRCEKDADIYLTPNRAYSPALGRWLTPDPLGTLPNAKQGNRFAPLSQYTDGQNLYEYCAGDPVNERDLRGLWCKDKCKPQSSDATSIYLELSNTYHGGDSSFIRVAIPIIDDVDDLISVNILSSKLGSWIMDYLGVGQYTKACNACKSAAAFLTDIRLIEVYIGFDYRCCNKLKSCPIKSAITSALGGRKCMLKYWDFGKKKEAKEYLGNLSCGTADIYDNGDPKDLTDSLATSNLLLTLNNLLQESQNNCKLGK